MQKNLFLFWKLLQYAINQGRCVILSKNKLDLFVKLKTGVSFYVLNIALSVTNQLKS